MVGPLIIVDSDRKGRVFLDYFDQQAEIAFVQSPPCRCSYKEIEDEAGMSHLNFSFSPLPSHTRSLEAIDKCQGEIFLAFDGDMTGEYLGWLVQGYIYDQKGSLDKVRRLQVSCFSKGGIERAFEKPGSCTLEEKPEFYIRSLFDSGFGAHLQRLTGSRVGPGGRPLTSNSLTSIFLLADRETEIQMFVPKKKWQIIVELGVGDKNFKARLEKVPGVTTDGFIKDAEQGKGLVARFRERPFVVDQIERSELVIGAPAPYVLVELVHDAQVLYGYQPGKTVAIVKNLCAGVEVQGKYQGLVSSLSAVKDDCAELVAALQKTVLSLYGEESKGEAAYEWEAGMLFPLEPEIGRDILGKALDAESLKIYELISGRALASQMRDAAGEVVRVQVAAGDIIFQAHLNSITQQGFLSVYHGRYDAELRQPCPFTDLQEGQQVACLTVVPEQTAVILSEPYTIETLFADLADFSVAVEPHNIMMLQGLIDNGYMTISADGSIVAGPSADLVVKLINRAFPKMSGINLSAYIEQTVNEVLSGRKGLDFALKQFGQTLMIQGKFLIKAKLPSQLALKKRSSSTVIKQEPKKPTSISESLSDASASPDGQQEEIEIEQDESYGQDTDAGETAILGDEAAETPVPELPEAEDDLEEAQNEANDLVEEHLLAVKTEEDEVVSVEAANEEDNDFHDNGEDTFGGPEDFGGAVGADAQEAESLETKGDLVETDQRKACQVCGKIMILKKDQFGRFWSCSGFPSCRHSETYSAERQAAMTCPLCRENDLVTKRTPTGKVFYVCLDPDCEFMAWSTPHDISCQVCGSPYLVEKKSIKGKIHLRCPKAGCNYEQASPGEDGTDQFDENPKPEEAVRKKVRVVRRVKGAASGSSSSGGATKKVRVVRRRK